MKTLKFTPAAQPKAEILPLLADYQVNEAGQLVSAVVKEGTKVLPGEAFES